MALGQPSTARDQLILLCRSLGADRQKSWDSLNLPEHIVEHAALHCESLQHASVTLIHFNSEFFCCVVSCSSFFAETWRRRKE